MKPDCTRLSVCHISCWLCFRLSNVCDWRWTETCLIRKSREARSSEVHGPRRISQETRAKGLATLEWCEEKAHTPIMRMPTPRFNSILWWFYSSSDEWMFMKLLCPLEYLFDCIFSNNLSQMSHQYFWILKCAWSDSVTLSVRAEQNCGTMDFFYVIISTQYIVYCFSQCSKLLYNK